MLGQAAPQHLGEMRVRLDVDLVDHRAHHPHPVALEERVVEHDLVDRATHATLADDHDRRLEQRRHPRVREADHGAHPGVAGALDDQQVLIRADPRRRLGHVALEVSSTLPMM